MDNCELSSFLPSFVTSPCGPLLLSLWHGHRNHLSGPGQSENLVRRCLAEGIWEGSGEAPESISPHVVQPENMVAPNEEVIEEDLDAGSHSQNNAVEKDVKLNFSFMYDKIVEENLGTSFACQGCRKKCDTQFFFHGLEKVLGKGLSTGFQLGTRVKRMWDSIFVPRDTGQWKFNGIVLFFVFVQN